MKNKVVAWSLFDVANQPFHTLIVTFIFIPYFNKFIAGGAEQGQILVSGMAASSAICIAICAPIISSIADKAGHRIRWMYFFSGLFVLGCCALVFDLSITWIMAAYILAYFTAEMSLITINAYLPELADDDRRIGEISGKAWGYGYLGGLFLLIVFLVFLMPNEGSDRTIVGLKALLGADASLWSGPATALWYVIFMIPFFRLFKNQPGEMSTREAIPEGLSSLKSSLLKVWSDVRLRWFTISSIVYRDAMAGIFVFGAIYAQNILGWGLTALGAYGIALNLSGTLGGVFGGIIDKKYGANVVVKGSIWIFIILCFIIMSTNRSTFVFMPIAEGSSLPDITFFICGLFIGIGAGSLQGASRGMVVPESRGKMSYGEAFGIYGMMGRATAFIAPMLVGITTAITGNSQTGVWPIFFLFVISLVTFKIFEKKQR